MSVGENIRLARKKSGLTQKELGDLCGIAEPTIRRYELGKLNPKIKTIEKIANALSVSPLDLMGYDLFAEHYTVETKKGKKRIIRDNVEFFEYFFKVFDTLSKEDQDSLLLEIRDCIEETKKKQNSNKEQDKK